MNKSVNTILAIVLTITLNIGIISYVHAASADTLINLANSSRSQNGLANLTENSKLTTAAYAKANDMLTNDYFAHTSPAGKMPWDFIKAAGYDYIYAGENLAIGYVNDQELHDAWMNSPTHRANIMNENFREIGIAVVTGEYDGAQTTVVVQMFGTPVPVAVAAVPTVESAQTQTEVVAVTESVTLNQEKTNFTPSQIFAGEKVKFTVVTTGNAKTILIIIADQKIDLMEAATIGQDGAAKIYTKEVEIEKAGDWPVTLMVTGGNGPTQTMNMGTLKIAQKTITKEVGTTTGQYKNTIIMIFIIITLGLSGILIYRYWPKKIFA